MPNPLRRRVQPTIVRPPASTPLRPQSRPVYVVRTIGVGGIVAIAVLAAALVLIGMALMLWSLQARVTFGPTPTPTATSAARATATPDFRATRVAEDILTQEAYLAAAPATDTPPAATDTPQPEAPAVVVPTDTPPAEAEPEVPMTATIVVLLPGIPGAGSLPTATPVETPLAVAGDSPLITPAPPATSFVAVPILAGQSPLATPPATQIALQPAETPTLPPALPTDTPMPPAPEPPTPELPTPVPPTPSPTPLPTTQPYLVNSLNANIRDAETVGYRDGPSGVFTNTRTFGANASVTVIGRTPTGEWVYVCCVDGSPAWVRQAHVRINGNTLPEPTPEGVDPNDVRRVATLPAASVPGLPPVTPIPEGNYPLYRYTPGAQAQLPRVPIPQVSAAWPNAAQAAGPLTSPVVVAGASVAVASADGHIYSFDRLNGNQRWRRQIGTRIDVSPAALDDRLYVAGSDGRIFGFIDRGNSVDLLWEFGGIGQPAVTSFNVYSGTLLIGAGAAPNFQILALNRDSGRLERSYPLSGDRLTYPAIGDQLLYLGGEQLVAVDVLRLGPTDRVWTRGDIPNITAGPVYASPGVRGLAELYVVDGNNRIWSLDANTGREIWNLDNGERAPATGLAVSSTNLLISGEGYLKAVDRDTAQQRWRISIPGMALGGPWTDNNRVMVLTNGGNLIAVDLANGANLGSTSSIPAPAGGSAALSAPWIFVPGSNGTLYALREGQ